VKIELGPVAAQTRDDAPAGRALILMAPRMCHDRDVQGHDRLPARKRLHERKRAVRSAREHHQMPHATAPSRVPATCQVTFALFWM
jgi:hypothetical protein